MGNRTALYELHLAASGKIVDFSGWDMPIHYGSQIEEHHHVRRTAGIFDVSHMAVVDVDGPEARNLLRQLLAADVARLDDKPGKALYSAMLNPAGGVIDDLIIYLIPGGYRLVLNCANRDKDLAWMRTQAADFEVQLQERTELAILAIQGPDAIRHVSDCVNAEREALIARLAAFHGEFSADWFIAKTGYTGEQGLEIILPHVDAINLWQALVTAGVKPCGLGARDTLRLEAGMNLYGQEMDEDTSPLVANMGWTVHWEPAERDFIGREALEQQRAQGVQHKLVGLVMRERGVLRGGQIVTLPHSEDTGIITSGSFSPTLGCSIAIARVPMAAGDTAEVDLRGRTVSVQVVKPNFVRHGQALIQ